MNLTPKVQKAIIKATILHYSQKRKGDGLPYIIHPYSVAFILANYTDDENIIVAGLLHDVLEDVSGYSIDDIKRDFGDKVAQIVKDVSEEEDSNNGFETKKATWQKRKQRYLDHLRDASFEAMMVCAADKIHNLISLMEAYRTQGNKIERKFNAPIDKKLWFYGEVLKILKDKLKNEIVSDLNQVYSKVIDLIKTE